MPLKATPAQEPAVLIKRPIQPDDLICLNDEANLKADTLPEAVWLGLSDRLRQHDATWSFLVLGVKRGTPVVYFRMN